MINEPSESRNVAPKELFDNLLIPLASKVTTLVNAIDPNSERAKIGHTPTEVAIIQNTNFIGKETWGDKERPIGIDPTEIRIAFDFVSDDIPAIHWKQLVGQKIGGFKIKSVWRPLRVLGKIDDIASVTLECPEDFNLVKQIENKDSLFGWLKENYNKSIPEGLSECMVSLTGKYPESIGSVSNAFKHSVDYQSIMDKVSEVVRRIGRFVTPSSIKAMLNYMIPSDGKVYVFGDKLNSGKFTTDITHDQLSALRQGIEEDNMSTSIERLQQESKELHKSGKFVLF